MSAPMLLGSEGEESETVCLLVSSDVADLTRKELHRSKLLESSKRLKHLEDSRKVAIPLKVSHESDLASPEWLPLLNSLKDAIRQKKGLQDTTAVFQVHRLVMPFSKQSVIESPVKALTRRLEELLRGTNCAWTRELGDDIPSQWERHGDLVLLGQSALCRPEWKALGEELWKTVSECLSCTRVARKSYISKDGFRSPQVKMLYGTDGWVQHIDNGIKYTYDVTKCMFSAGNITEKLRVAQMDCKGDVIVDLYAGIGYFTLPYLVHGGAKHLHACEWNPDALGALRRGLVLNGVAERCTIHFGDNRLVCPKGVADRVNLGLIPSSEQGWPTACGALKSSTGGIMHIHANVSTIGNTACALSQSVTKECCRNTNKASVITDETDEATIEGEDDSCVNNHMNFCYSNSNQTHDRLCHPPGSTIEIECIPLHGTNLIKQSYSNTANNSGDVKAELSNIQHLSNLQDTTETVKIQSDLENKIKQQSQSPDQINNTVIGIPTLNSSKRRFLPWAINVSYKIKTLLQALHRRPWQTTIIHIERVKSYAPHIDHIVLDLDCRPSNH